MYLFDRWYVDAYMFRRVAIALGALVFLTAVALWLTTGKNPVKAAVGRGEPPHPCLAFAVDVGTSTARDGDATLRTKYLSWMHDALEGAAHAKAEVYVGYFAGQPPLEYQPYRFDQTSHNGYNAGIDGARLIAGAQAELTHELSAPDEVNDGSAVIATVDELARNTPRGCSATIVSDGIEDSDLGSFGVGGSTPMVALGAVDTLMQRMTSKRVVPDLTGRSFAMPFLTQTSGIAPRGVYDPTRRRQATRDFWTRFAVAAHTTLTAPNQ